MSQDSALDSFFGDSEEEVGLEDNFGVEVGEQLFDDLDLNDELNGVPIRDFTGEEVVGNGKEADKEKESDKGKGKEADEGKRN